jgi:hypothetical protein
MSLGATLASIAIVGTALAIFLFALAVVDECRAAGSAHPDPEMEFRLLTLKVRSRWRYFVARATIWALR